MHHYKSTVVTSPCIPVPCNTVTGTRIIVYFYCTDYGLLLFFRLRLASHYNHRPTVAFDFKMTTVSGITTVPVSSRRRQRVSFARSVKARRTLHVSNYTDGEISDCWFSDEDLQQFRADVLHTVELISGDGEAQNLTERSSFCERGIEHRTQEGIKKRIRNKILARDAVLLEQERQWEHNIHDEEAIADAYRKVSAHCLFEARMRGLKDHQDATLDDFSVSLQNPKKGYSECRPVISHIIEACPHSGRHITFNAAA